ncbi:cytochrome P450 [Actinomadura napierensis]|uniref:Methyl-branched lipid omega-hydroxylase Cyp124 n=1 Tax=Actinomadura napierensis TaxID=267854 RepID=A0ABN2Y599_9ACTN
MTSSELATPVPRLGDLEFWKRPPAERDAAFRRLRQTGGPLFFDEPPMAFIPKGRGFHALVRHADVAEASRRPDVFSSEPNTTSIADMPGPMSRYFGSLINMDDPRHARLRRIVSRAFTPKMLAGTLQDVQTQAEGIVDELAARGGGDFVTDVAARLPVQVICDMMGVPAEQRAFVVRRANLVLAGFDSEYLGMDVDGLERKPFVKRFLLRGNVAVRYLRAGRALHSMAMNLAKQRRTHPRDDLTTRLVTANVDGEHLTDQELGSFFILLLVAGSETTRNALAHGLHLLTTHPEQRALLLEDFDGRIDGAIEEIVRYATPVIAFRRTVTCDHEMHGVQLHKGDKVVLYYNSANRDEDVFTDPDAFDITRSPNPHLGFGGPGPHFCLGAHLARREISVMFRELFTRLPELRSTAEPDRLLSTLINGIKHLPCRT